MTDVPDFVAARPGMVPWSGRPEGVLSRAQRPSGNFYLESFSKDPIKQMGRSLPKNKEMGGSLIKKGSEGDSRYDF